MILTKLALRFRSKLLAILLVNKYISQEVPIPYTSSLGLFEEDIVWKGFINTDPIDDEKM